MVLVKLSLSNAFNTCTFFDVSFMFAEIRLKDINE